MRKLISVTQPHQMVTILEFEIRFPEQIKFLMLSDLHLDHPKCNRRLLKEHMDQAMKENAYIIMNGDIFCVMQGKFDKRGNKGDVRPEDMRGDYFDKVVDNAVDFFKPYAKKILFMGVGNHENSIIKRSEFDLLRMFSDRLYMETKHRVAVGQYQGWIWVKMVDTVGKSRREMHTLSYVIYHNHGSGGDAPVTGGTIEDHRKMTHVEGADAIWMGHNHNKYARQQAVHYLDRHVSSLKPKLRIVDSIRSGTYKQEYTGNGWHVEKGFSPKPLGGVWLTLIARRTQGQTRFLESQVITTWHEPIEI